MRIGLLEMKRFCQEFFENVKPDTFLQESAGVADLITTCQSRFTVKAITDSQVSAEGTGSVPRRSSPQRRYVTIALPLMLCSFTQPFDVLEKEMLNGQSE
jgi:hypothetical protein